MDFPTSQGIKNLQCFKYYPGRIMVKFAIEINSTFKDRRSWMAISPKINTNKSNM